MNQLHGVPASLHVAERIGALTLAGVERWDETAVRLGELIGLEVAQ